jgi:hypothetical protein
MTVEEYPSIGSTLDAVVLGFKDSGHQIWLGLKPSQIRSANLAESHRLPHVRVWPDFMAPG